jgi:hypothetical protein
MKRLRWQILVVLATLVVVSVLLLSQQPVLTPILPEAAPGGVYTEAVVSSDKTTINLNFDVSRDVTIRGSVSTEGETALGIYFERDY